MIRWDRKDFPEFRMRKSYGDHKSYLQIIDVRHDDEGYFTCTAFNGVGEADQKTSLMLVKSINTVEPAFYQYSIPEREN